MFIRTYAVLFKDLKMHRDLIREIGFSAGCSSVFSRENYNSHLLILDVYKRSMSYRHAFVIKCTPQINACKQYPRVANISLICDYGSSQYGFIIIVNIAQRVIKE